MFVIVLLFVWQGSWSSAAIVLAILVFYLLALRLTRCRVQTTQRRPCRWLVRGLLGTCDYHVGYKNRLPIAIRGGRFGLPALMWPRTEFALASARPDPQPAYSVSPMDAVAKRAKTSRYDTAMLVLALLGVLITFLAFVRDLIAGS